MTAAKMLAEARKDLGMAGRPNQITKDYASRNGSEFLRAPWCAMSVTHWARQSGNEKSVLPAGDRAYTVWFAEDGRKLGRWCPGTSENIRRYAKPGAVVFFDWDGTNTIGRIDHVGIVEHNLGDGRVQTIEGNTGDACKRRVRASNVIAGFWNPAYETAKPKPEPNWTEDLVKKKPTLRLGDGKGDKSSLKWHVKDLHHSLLSHDYGGLDGADDTVFTEAHRQGVLGLQKAAGIAQDGIVGPQTWAVLWRVAD